MIYYQIEKSYFIQGHYSWKLLFTITNYIKASELYVNTLSKMKKGLLRLTEIDEKTIKTNKKPIRMSWSDQEINRRI